MSKRGQPQKVQTKIPSQKSIAAFFSAKNPQKIEQEVKGTSSKKVIGDRLSPIENSVVSLNFPKRIKVHHSFSGDSMSTVTTSTSSKPPVFQNAGFAQNKENYRLPDKDDCVILDSPNKENDEAKDLHCNDEFDDACLRLITVEDDEEMIAASENIENLASQKLLKPSDLIRGRIANVLSTGQNVELTLTGGDIPENTTMTVILDGYWVDSVLEVGDTCHIVMEQECQLSCGDKPVVDDLTNLLVLHPDTLVSATSLVGALNCLRQTVLNEKFPFPSVSVHAPTTNKAMLIGKAVHLLFQWAIIQRVESKKLIDDKLLQSHLKEILAAPDFLQDLYSIGQSSCDEIISEIASLYIPTILQFSTSSVGELTGVRDIEENVWSPRFGVKGKVDATINILPRSSKSSSLVPLELKTGQASKSREHFGQAMLYSLLLADRYGSTVVPDFGLLSYLKNGNKDSYCIRVSRAKSAIHGLLQTRNELAHFLAKPWSPDPSSLPPPVLNERTCSWCSQSVNCALMHLSDPDETSRSNRKISSVVSKLALSYSTEEVELWQKWIEILNAEYGQQENVEKWLNKFWTSSLDEMEATGLTLGHLELTNVTRQENGVIDCDHCLEFSRLPGFFVPNAINSAASPFSESFSADENFRPRMLISSGQPGDRKFVGLTFGTLQSITNTDGQLRYQLITEKDFQRLYPNIKEYRLDVVSSSFSNGFSYKMGVSNMSTLFDNSPDFERLRNLVVGHRLPQRHRKLKRCDADLFHQIQSVRRLTRQQKEVVLRVLTAEDYLLVRGYPGTGKSTTIATLVRCFVALGQSVLIASYTNTAVDSILMKLIAECDESKILRLGPLDRMNPNIHRFAERSRLPSVSTLDGLNDLYQTPSVVAGTCHSLFGHPLFSRRKFSICIVEEASQTLLPTCIGPILCAEKFVLVGDPNQLSPLIVNANQQAAGRPLSLLEHLLAICKDRAPEAICDLTEQFRMNTEILRVPNALYYENRLSCSKEVDPIQYLVSSKFDNLLKKSRSLEKLCSSDLLDSFLFFDTSKLLLSDKEVLSCMPTEFYTPSNSRTSNVQEAIVVAKIVQLLLKLGVESAEIGVISPFTDQVRLVSQLLLLNGEKSEVEVNTVDQYQGREKAVIIISFVKTGSTDRDGEQGRSGKGILTSCKRLNVALTRARSKLIAVGSKDFLCASFSPIADMVALLRNDQIFTFDLTDFNCLSHMIVGS